MKKQIIKYTELLLTIVLAFLLWWSANRIVQSPQTENWWQPIVFFSLFFILWSLGAVLIKKTWLFFAVTGISLLSALFWTQKIGYFFVIILAVFFLVVGRQVVREELNSRIKISIWNSLRLERRFFVLAVALMLTGQYFFGVNQLNANKELPEFKISNNQAKLITKIFAKFDPTFKTNNIGTMTVDEFILQKMSDGEDGMVGANIENYKNIIPKNYNLADVNNSTFAKSQKELLLQKGRESFSKMVERKVNGDEKILDIFSEIINNKIGKFANNNIGYVDQNIPIMHWVFTLLLFLTIFSLGMFLSPFLIMLTWLLFKFMVAVGFISIKRKVAEVEIVG